MESVLLAIGGAIAGLVVAIAAARLLLALAFQNAHFLPIRLAPSPLVLGFAFILALVTGVIFGAAPAWFATRMTRRTPCADRAAAPVTVFFRAQSPAHCASHVLCCAGGGRDSCWRAASTS